VIVEKIAGNQQEIRVPLLGLQQDPFNCLKPGVLQLLDHMLREPRQPQPQVQISSVKK
jgi:hypothetical protein